MFNSAFVPFEIEMLRQLELLQQLKLPVRVVIKILREIARSFYEK
jgi:hypothetical protein